MLPRSLAITVLFLCFTPLSSADVTAADCLKPSILIRIGPDGAWLAYLYLFPDFGFEVFELSIYLETNGTPDLQMGGESLFGKEAGCWQSETPDLMII